MVSKIKNSLLLQIIIAVALGVICSHFTPVVVARLFATINSIFSNFLGFIIPLIIIGLVAPGILELGRGAGKLLAITALIAYGSTIFAGFFSYSVCQWSYPMILSPSSALQSGADVGINKITPFFSVEMPPIMSVTTALILAFVLGLGLSAVENRNFKALLSEFKLLIENIISKAIIPLLPLYIFGIFLIMGLEGQASSLLSLFLRVIAVIVAIHVVLLLIQFTIAGVICGKNPLKALLNMAPAYMTALGTQSSAATIPITLKQAVKNGVRENIADFVVPLCATIHLAGSTLKIVACAFAIMYMGGVPIELNLFSTFIFTLGVTMVAAPGVPGGAIMAALALLSSILGFDENLQGLMIALYITMDSFGTACNVTGDGAIAMIINKIYKKNI